MILLVLLIEEEKLERRKIFSQEFDRTTERLYIPNYLYLRSKAWVITLGSASHVQHWSCTELYQLLSCLRCVLFRHLQTNKSNRAVPLAVDCTGTSFYFNVSFLCLFPSLQERGAEGWEPSVSSAMQPLLAWLRLEVTESYRLARCECPINKTSRLSQWTMNLYCKTCTS